jgi:hypothetical protein
VAAATTILSSFGLFLTEKKGHHMNYEEIVDLMNNDPVVQDLLQAPIPARLAYVATDGTPRVIPVSYL